MTSLSSTLLSNSIPSQPITHKRKVEPNVKNKFKKAKKLEQFYQLAQQNDYKLWKNSEVIAIEAKRYLNFNWETDPIAPTAESLLAIAYHANCLLVEKPKENIELVNRIRKRVRHLTYLTQADTSYKLLLPEVELCRLLKILNLVSGKDGKELRAFLYPVLYHCKQANETRSQPEIIQEGIEIASYLLELKDDELLSLSLPSLDKLPAEEQKKIIRSWLVTFQARAAMIKVGKEPLLSRYYIDIKKEGEKTIFVGSDQFHNQLFAYSHLIESFCITARDGTWAEPYPLSTFEIDLPLCESFKYEVTPLFLVAFQKDYPLADYDLKDLPFEKQRTEKAIQLEAEFLKGRLPDLTPTQWPKKIGARISKTTIPSLFDLQKQMRSFVKKKQEEMEKKGQ